MNIPARRFQDLIVWQKARLVAREIFLLTEQELVSRDFRFKDQIRSSSVSAMSNIAEGFERDGVREFRQFLSVAKGSCGELESQLFVAHDRGYLDSEKFEQLCRDVSEVSRMLAGLMKYLEKTEMKGTKFKSRTRQASPKNEHP